MNAFVKSVLSKEIADVIADKVCSEFGVYREEVFSRKRTDHVVMVRHCIAWILATGRGIGQRQIGQYLDRNHENICLGIRSFKARIDTDANIARKAETLRYWAWKLQVQTEAGRANDPR